MATAHHANIALGRGFSANAHRMFAVQLLDGFKKASPKAPTAAVYPEGETTLTISQEALRLWEDRRETAEERIKRALEERDGAVNMLRETQKNTPDWKAIRIGEIKQRIKQLKDMITQAMMWGDKRAAAAIAKEAAQLAKELKGLLRDTGGGIAALGDAVSIPNIGTEGGTAEDVEGTEALQNVGIDEMAGEEAGPEEIGTGAETEEIAAEKSAKEAEDLAAEAARDGAEGQGSDKAAGRPQKGSGKALADKIVDRSKAKGLAAQNAHARKEMIDEIVSDLRYIIAAAKAALKQKDPLSGNLPQSSFAAATEERVAAQAEKDIEKAAAEIEMAIAAFG